METILFRKNIAGRQVIRNLLSSQSSRFLSVGSVFFSSADAQGSTHTSKPNPNKQIQTNKRSNHEKPEPFHGSRHAPILPMVGRKIRGWDITDGYYRQSVDYRSIVVRKRLGLVVQPTLGVAHSRILSKRIRSISGTTIGKRSINEPPRYAPKLED